jgi:tetratricopeptide (TPR) repeat protein
LLLTEDYTALTPVILEAVEAARGFVADTPRLLDQSLGLLAHCHGETGRYTKAAQSWEELVRLQKTTHGDDDPVVAHSLLRASHCHSVAGDKRAAMAAALEAVRISRISATDRGSLRLSIEQLAHLLVQHGEREAGIAALRECVEIGRGMGAEVFPELARNLRLLALLMLVTQGADAAEPLARESLDLCRRAYRDDSDETASSLVRLASIECTLGRLAQGEARYREALAMFKRVHTGPHEDTIECLRDLAMSLAKQRRSGACEHIREAVEMSGRLRGWEHEETVELLDESREIMRALTDREVRRSGGRSGDPTVPRLHTSGTGGITAA